MDIVDEFAKEGAIFEYLVEVFGVAGGVGWGAGEFFDPLEGFLGDGVVVFAVDPGLRLGVDAGFARSVLAHDVC